MTHLGPGIYAELAIVERPGGDKTPVALRCEPAPESGMLPEETDSDVLAGCCVQILAKVVATSGETFFKVNSNGHEGFIKASYVNVHHRRERKRQRRS